MQNDFLGTDTKFKNMRKVRLDAFRSYLGSSYIFTDPTSGGILIADDSLKKYLHNCQSLSLFTT
jgi:hypothetical protein